MIIHVEGKKIDCERSFTFLVYGNCLLLCEEGTDFKLFILFFLLFLLLLCLNFLLCFNLSCILGILFLFFGTLLQLLFLLILLFIPSLQQFILEVTRTHNLYRKLSVLLKVVLNHEFYLLVLVDLRLAFKDWFLWDPPKDVGNHVEDKNLGCLSTLIFHCREDNFALDWS